MYDTSRNILINLEICPNQLCTKPRTKNRSRGGERLKRNQHLALKYRYAERAFGKGKETAATQATHVVYCTAGSQLDIGIVALVRESCFEININIWELDMNIKNLMYRYIV